MEENLEFRKVTQDVLLFVWFKHESLSEEPPKETGLIPYISDELMNNLSVSVWFESFRTQFIWGDFFKNHFERMTSSSELFANYVAYASYVLYKSTNPYECFFDIFSIVSEFSLRCLEGNRLKYVNACVDLFCTFFEKELYWNFKHQGGWEKFNEYIEKQYNSIQSKCSMIDNKSLLNQFNYFLESFESDNRPNCGISMVFIKKKRQPLYVVNGILLKDVTRNHVETHEKSVNFAKSIRYKLEKLVQKTFYELIMDFRETYNQVKKRHGGTNEEFFNGIKNKDGQWNLVKHQRKKKQLEQCFSQEVQRQNIQTSSGEMKRQAEKGCPRKVSEMKTEVEQRSLRKVQEYPSETKSKDEQWIEVKQRQKKKQTEQRSSQEIQLSPGRTKGDVRKRQNIQESSDGMKRQAEKGCPRKAQISSSEMKTEVEQHSLRKVQEYPSETKIKDEQWIQVKQRQKKKQTEQRSSQEIQLSPGRAKSDERKRQNIQESSDGMKRQVEQDSSQKVHKSPRKMKNNVEKRQTFQESLDGMKSKGEYSPNVEASEILSAETANKELERKTVTQNVLEYSIKMKNKEKRQNIQESSDEMKRQVQQDSSRKVQKIPSMENKDEQWNLVKHHQKKTEQCSSQAQLSPGGMKNYEGKRQNFNESFDGMKRQVDQGSLIKVQEPPKRMESKDEEWNLVTHRRKKKQSEQCSQKIQVCPGGIKDNERKQQNIQESSDEMKRQVEQDAPRENHKSCKMKSNSEQQNIQESSDGMKRQVNQDSSRKDQISPNGMKSKSEWNQVKRRQKKKRAEQRPSKEIQLSPGKMKGNERKQQNIQESSDGMKRQAEKGCPRKVQISSCEMKTKMEQIFQVSPGGKERNGKQRQMLQESPGEKESNGKQRQMLQESPGEKKSNGEQRQIFQESPCEKKSNGEQRRMLQESLGEMKRDGEQRQMFQESLGEKKSTGEQRQIFQESLNKKRKKEQLLTTQESSKRMKGQGEYSSPHAEPLEIISSKTANKNLERITMIARNALNTPNLDTIILQNRVASNQESHLKLESTKTETAKKLLGEMSLAIANIAKIIQSLCEKHEVQIPVKLQVIMNAQNL